jgi:hypothetical protein
MDNLITKKKRNPPFQLSKIYIIVCFESGRVYVGSTTDKHLRSRLADHQTAWRRFKRGLRPNDCSSTEIIATGNFSIFLLENYPCNTFKELLDREGYWIEQYGHSCVNRRILRPRRN